MFNILMVGCGGFLGAISRYSVGLLLNRVVTTPIPLATLTVNFVGAFLIGLITALAAKAIAIPQPVLLFLTVGILGGFTTFSTFSLESINLLEQGKILLLATNICLNVGLCLFACWLGKIIIK